MISLFGDDAIVTMQLEKILEAMKKSCGDYEKDGDSRCHDLQGRKVLIVV